jgi:RHS repeat-associated protein
MESLSSKHYIILASDGTVSYLYDGDGNRVAKSVNGVVTRYLVDDLNPAGLPQVVDELTNGVVLRTYSYGLQRISQNQVISNTWTPSFFGYDGFGTVRQLTNAVGALTDTYDFDAFGNKLYSSGATPNNYLYRGEQWDSDLGFYYLRDRYYNPASGRFVVGDEIESRESKTGKIENREVTALTKPHHDKLLEVRVEGEHSPLRPSTRHPFWARHGDDTSGRWIVSGQLQAGDLLQTLDGQWRRITAITPLQNEATVYNFTVANDHDYFVGQTGFLVHNAGGCGCKPINYVRPYIQQWVKDAVMEAADFTEDGLMIDPNSRIPFAGPADLGHKPGFEWRNLKQAAGREGLTQQESRRPENPAAGIWPGEDQRENGHV